MRDCCYDVCKLRLISHTCIISEIKSWIPKAVSSLLKRDERCFFLTVSRKKRFINIVTKKLLSLVLVSGVSFFVIWQLLIGIQLLRKFWLMICLIKDAGVTSKLNRISISKCYDDLFLNEIKFGELQIGNFQSFSGLIRSIA